MQDPVESAQEVEIAQLTGMLLFARARIDKSELQLAAVKVELERISRSSKHVREQMKNEIETYTDLLLKYGPKLEEEKALRV